MSGFMTLLAVAGAAALGIRLFRSLGWSVLSAAQYALAANVAENSARRGDLTRMQEGKVMEARARAARFRAMGTAAFWGIWIALPLALGVYVAEAYALAAPLWLIPTMRRSAPDSADDAEPGRGA